MKTEIRLDEQVVSNLAQVITTVADGMGIKMDANESIFFARELESIKTREIEIEYPALKARTVIPIETDVDPGAETFTYRVYNFVGFAKVITDYADDLPSFDALGAEQSSRVIPLGGSYSYSIQELRAAIFARRSLEEKKQKAAVWGMRKKENSVLFFGDVSSGVPGFLNQGPSDTTPGNVPMVVLPSDGTGSSKTWATKTSVQILRDLNLMVNTVREQSKGIHELTTIALPLTSWGIINTKPWGLDSDKTVLMYFKQNNPGVEVIWLNELETAGVGGAIKRMIGYTRRPECVAGQIPQDYEQFPPQPKGLRFMIPCHSRVGGTIFPMPLSAVMADGL